jgi:lipopolysaccharide/colanic/teichoic acid biosynthesis glycosyltransferase
MSVAGPRPHAVAHNEQIVLRTTGIVWRDRNAYCQLVRIKR